MEKIEILIESKGDKLNFSLIESYIHDNHVYTLSIMTFDKSILVSKSNSPSKQISSFIKISDIEPGIYSNPEDNLKYLEEANARTRDFNIKKRQN
jgi:hypothetical protein